MPYIESCDRLDLTLSGAAPETPGELNYLLTLMCQDYLRENELRYQTLNDIIGALESCKLEFYRRVVTPYEDTKIKENGDVYT